MISKCLIHLFIVKGTLFSENFGISSSNFLLNMIASVFSKTRFRFSVEILSATTHNVELIYSFAEARHVLPQKNTNMSSANPMTALFAGNVDRHT